MTSDMRDLCYILTFGAIAMIGLFGLGLEFLAL